MLGFIVAAIAGFIVPQLERPLGRPVARFLAKYITLEDSETRLITFIVALIGAGIIGSLLDSGSAFWMTVAAVLGYFGSRFAAAGKTAINDRKSD